MWSFSLPWISPEPQREYLVLKGVHPLDQKGPWTTLPWSWTLHLSLCLPASVEWSHPWQNFATLTDVGPFHYPQVLLSQSGYIKVEPFVKSIILVPFSTVSVHLFYIIKAPNIHNILVSHNMFWGQSAGRIMADFIRPCNAEQWKSPYLGETILVLYIPFM